tara:strand:- start:72427 stop:73314 length:888 start_codon:yes stop_codon:yes gene_type:complete
MQGRILAFSGTKQSGKTTCSNFLHGYQMACHGIVEDFQIADGDLVVTTNIIDEQGREEKGNAVLDVSRTDLQFSEWAIYSMWPYVKKYSFAAPLKEIATGLFGLSHEQCYGTDSQKNTLTNIKWGDLPLKINNKKKRNKKMTAREFLQYFGTDVCRKIYDNIWVDRCIADIKFENPLLSIVDDCRFPNEADAIQRAGGKVIRLTRSPHQDSHASESALSEWDNFDAVIDNEGMTIHESCKELIRVLGDWGWLGKETTLQQPNEKLAKHVQSGEPVSEPEPQLVGGIHTIKEVTGE